MPRRLAMSRATRIAVLVLALAIVCIPIVDLTRRVVLMAGDLQSVAPATTPFIGLLLAISEFTIFCVFATLSMFVPGSRWARLWAIYHFAAGLSATYHGTPQFWQAWRPASAVLDAVAVTCVAGGIEEYAGRPVGWRWLLTLSSGVWVLILLARWAGLHDGGAAYLGLLFLANCAGCVMIFRMRRGAAGRVIACAMALYAMQDLTGIQHEFVSGPGSLSIFPVLLNTAAGLAILLAALFEYQKQLELAHANSERSRAALSETAMHLERRSAEFAAERDRAQMLATVANENHERLQLLLAHAPASLAMFDRSMHYLAASRRWLVDYGLELRNVIGMSFYEALPRAPAGWRAIHQRALEGQVMQIAEDRLEQADGSTRWLQWEVHPWRGAGGQIDGVVVFSEDITERKRVEDELRIAATAFESQEGVVVTDPTGTVLRVNQAFSRLTGYAPGDIIGKPVAGLGDTTGDRIARARIVEHLVLDGYWQGELWDRRRDGRAFAAWLTISAVKGATGQTTHYVGAFADITGNKEAEAQIHRLAYYDSLTQLPNRRLLQDRMAQMLSSGRRETIYRALIFLDLDNFKVLNDTRGHDVGDQLLVEAARRIQGSVRGRDTVARLGGDEFVVVLEDLGTDMHNAVAHAGTVGEKLRLALALPYVLGPRQFHCAASLGITLFRGDDDSVENILKHADLAMYQAKNAGRNTLCFFDPAMQTALNERSALESDLRLAAELSELELHYQPQADGEGRITGVEALLRWHHRERGVVLPGDFIPVAEQSGLILTIGRWVLESACRQIAAWASDAATRDLHLAVNVSARQFRQPDFVDGVREILRSSGADPARLKIEITESVVLDDLADTFAKMNELMDLGIRFALDDFGTGNSSLSYLSRLPLNELKIDKSFVLNLPDNRSDAIIVQTIITMATSLGLKVIAEGVETHAQRAFLRQHGCDAYQGYLFSRPLPLQELESLIARQ